MAAPAAPASDAASASPIAAGPSAAGPAPAAALASSGPAAEATASPAAPSATAAVTAALSAAPTFTGTAFTPPAASAPPPASASPPPLALLHSPQPPYPSLSRRLGEEGRVLLRVLVGSDGRPARAELSASSGSERLDRAATQAVMAWRFSAPAAGSGSGGAWVTVPIVYRLDNP